jgi:hypothetical protein
MTKNGCGAPAMRLPLWRRVSELGCAGDAITQRTVLQATEWPTRNHSIKTLAKYLGFEWRDGHPSGAASVELFDRWCRERDPALKQRLLQYNEDDCRATRVLLDGIRSLGFQHCL